MSDDQCTEVGGRAGMPLAQCVKMAGHVTAHDNGTVMWPVSHGGPQDDQCTATTQTGFGVVRCQLPTGHPEHHTNQQYRWHDPRCSATTFVNSDVGMVACSLLQGHTGDHIENDTGRALCWPRVVPMAPDPGPVTDRATHHYSSKQLAGANRDDLIRNLFERVEQLEQTSANAGAVDHMFGSTNLTVERLVSGLGEIERRMTALEGRDSRGSISISNVNTQFERLNGAICTVNGEAQERHQETGARLKAMWDVLAAMAPVIDSLKPASLKVPQAACGATHPVESGRTCVRPAGHTAAHKSSSRGDVRLVWNDEQVPDRQEERASGSPAPARCPAQFREGQCLGYAGHDGECSALPDPREPQLEDLSEFAGSTYDRSSDGTPLEDLAEFTEQMDHEGGYPSDPVDPFQD